MDSLEARVTELRRIEEEQIHKEWLQRLKDDFPTWGNPDPKRIAEQLLAGQVFLYLKRRKALQHLEEFWALFEGET